MKSDIVLISTTGKGMDEALSMTERTGIYCGLQKESNLRLRLLGEEMIGLMRGITGEIRAEYWIENSNGQFELHMKTSDVVMNQDLRKEIIAVSTSGRNSAARGIMGKIREMIAVMLLPDDPETESLKNIAIGAAYLGTPMGIVPQADSYLWSMQDYIKSVQDQCAVREEAKEAKDELEKSIVANLADDVKVTIVGPVVEIVIYKRF